MKTRSFLLLVTVLGINIAPAIAQNAPQVSTRKVDGTDNVYVFRYGNHQSMFIVTSQVSSLLIPSPINVRPSPT